MSYTTECMKELPNNDSEIRRRDTIWLSRGGFAEMRTYTEEKLKREKKHVYKV